MPKIALIRQLTALTALAAAAVLSGCGVSRPLPLGSAEARTFPEPVEVAAVSDRPLAVLAAGHSEYSFGGYGFGGPGYYGRPIEGGLTLHAFAMPYVEAHGDGNFVDSGVGWGAELGIWGRERTGQTGGFPGNGFISVSRSELDEPVANVTTPYWIVSAGMRMPIVGNRQVMGVLGGGASYHRFARPQTDDVWGFGGFLSFGVAWTPIRNLYIGADIQGHVWAPEEGDGGTTFTSTIGAMVWF